MMQSLSGSFPTTRLCLCLVLMNLFNFWCDLLCLIPSAFGDPSTLFSCFGSLLDVIVPESTSLSRLKREESLPILPTVRSPSSNDGRADFGLLSGLDICRFESPFLDSSNGVV